MRTLLTCLAIAGVIVAAAGAVYREGLIILLGFAAVIIPLVMFAQGAVSDRRSSAPRRHRDPKPLSHLHR
ncbi:hypothetical protein OHA21_15195 [Actinoplanes sp. NBC_00393]|uniref:hypothetical protein n=1 Tax=Actinoplanes sp. NBC_00393 TaxID=2975953 RepID=UPI002E1FFEAB